MPYMVYPLWCEIAFREMLHGVREVPALANNARILEYHEKTNLKATDDETPWCAAFVGWCLNEARIMGSNLANARSDTDWGQRSEARLGGIAVLWRGEPNGWQGHVGFLVGEGGGEIRLLGGNQRDSVSIEPYAANRLIGYRWPRDLDRHGGNKELQHVQFSRWKEDAPSGVGLHHP